MLNGHVQPIVCHYPSFFCRFVYFLCYGSEVVRFCMIIVGLYWLYGSIDIC